MVEYVETEAQLSNDMAVDEESDQMSSLMSLSVDHSNIEATSSMHVYSVIEPLVVDGQDGKDVVLEPKSCVQVDTTNVDASVKDLEGMFSAI